MATKTANVTARVNPEIKEQAEAVLDRIGVPVSVLIDTLYRPDHYDWRNPVFYFHAQDDNTGWHDSGTI